MYQQRKLPSFNGVAAAATATLNLPLGPTYRQIILKFSNNAAFPNEATIGANITRIRLKINGVTQMDISAANRIAINRYYGLLFQNGYIVIPFTRKWMNTFIGEENTAIGTANLQSLSLEIDLAAGLVNPTLEAFAEIDPEARNLGTIVTVTELQYAASTTAIDFANLPSGNGDLIALHLKNANITDIALKINNIDVVQNGLELKQFAQDQGRVWQTGFGVHLDSLLQNNWSEIWPLNARNSQGQIVRALDTRLTGTLSGAGAIPIIMETLNQPLGRA